MSERKFQRNLILLFIVVLLLATLGFCRLEGLSCFDAFYLTVQTIWTVGYGDVAPRTEAGRFLATLVVILGASLGVYIVGEAIGFLANESLYKERMRRRMQKKIDQLKEHVILCGAGRVGTQVIKQLSFSRVPFVVIDNRPEVFNDLSHEILHLVGDATQDEILVAAGIKRASGLISALASDTDNVYVVLTAKGLNPNLQIVARAERPESVAKLKRAGADKVISPAEIGGRRMALSFIRPVGVSYIETIFAPGVGPLEADEIKLPSHFFLDKTIGQLNISENTKVMILAIKRGDQLIAPPAGNERLFAGDILLAVGAREDLDRLEGFLGLK